jgi:hypothetical protein
VDALHSEGVLIEVGYRRYGMHDLIRRYVRDRVAADRDQRPEHVLASEAFTKREVSDMRNNSERRDALLRLLSYYAFMASAASKSIGMHGGCMTSSPFLPRPTSQK